MTYILPSLRSNTKYRLNIRGINNAGLRASIKSLLLIPVDAASGLGAVSDGYDPAIDLGYQTNTTEVHATWTGFETPAVKIRAYFFAVGSCTRGNYHVTNNQFIPVIPPTATSFGVQGLRLVNGQRYCIKIKAENLARVQTEPVTSDGFLVDVTPPDLRNAMLLDGSGEDDLDYQWSRTELYATWSQIQDHESGIQRFEAAVSRHRADEPDVTPFTDIGLNSSVTVTGLRLSVDVYYIVLCAINNAGLKSCLASDGVLIDPTPSTTGVVHDGILEPDISFQAETRKLHANWERIWDLESRVERFEWGVREDNGELAQDFVNVGLQTHVTSEKDIALKHGHNYTVILRVYNRAGISQELSSNGVIVDTTPPVPSEIKPRLLGSEWRFVKETATYYSSNVSDIHVTWQNFEEPESELWFYKWAIGTSKYGAQLQPLINIGLATNANTSGNGLNFRPGVYYFVTVVGRNRANLVSGNCSSPFLFDYTAPRKGRIEIESSSGINEPYLQPNTSIHVSWRGFDDPESGIEKYKLSLEYNDTVTVNYTLPFSQTELEIPHRLLHPGKGYNVRLKSVNFAGLAVVVTSSPFSIDGTPPAYTGNARELPKLQFHSNPHSYAVSWAAFEDSECPVEFYEIGIGGKVSKDDIYKFTRTGLRTHFSFHDIDVQDNEPYYVTVNAHNMAGLVTSVLLEEIIFDRTAPVGNEESVKDGLLSDDIDYLSPQSRISASLVNVADFESGISRIEYCVGSTPYNCFIKPFTSIHQNRSFVCIDCKIDAGMTAFARFRVTNGAGLPAMFVSDGVTVDSSPPEIQSVYDGKIAKIPDVEKAYSNWTPEITWYGARDIQSGLQHCEWTIMRQDRNSTVKVYTKMLPKSDITYNIRHTETATILLNLTMNTSYINAIRCWNHAGITSDQYTNGWSVVEQWPIPAFVNDGPGPRDLKYVINGDTMEASWCAFHSDTKDPVLKYDWAVGTIGAIDDILEFTEVGLATTASISLLESDIKLKPGITYYTTVRATTSSGWTSKISSNGFIVDSTPPTAGGVKVIHRITNHVTNEVDYTLMWENFTDHETGILSYEYCLGYIKGVCATIVFNGELAFHGTVRGFVPEARENAFYGIVIVTNNAGLKTVVSSNAVNIDFTPPVTGSILDGVDQDMDYVNSSVSFATTWSPFTDPESGIKKCTLTVTGNDPNQNETIVIQLTKDVNANGSIVHDFQLTAGLRYISTIVCENRDGFMSSKSSNGVLVDDSPPYVGTILDKNGMPFQNKYQSSTSALHARWSAGYDLESGIMEYCIAVGSGSKEDDIRAFSSVGLAREIKVDKLTMNSGSTYYVTLEIANNAGLKSRVSSSGITIDTTPPVIKEVHLQRTTNGYIGPRDYLRGGWETYDDESDIDFVEYCFDTTSGGCSVQEMTRAFDNEMNVTCFNCKLKHRNTYYMAVRAWNNAGLFNLAATRGLVADLTAPVGGKVILNKTYMSCMDACSLAAEFREFKDEESGVASCEFSIKTANELTVVGVQTARSESDIEANNLTLQHGESYKIVVACSNNVGERSEDVSSPLIRVDNTPPKKGFVIVSPDQNHDARSEHVGCHFLNTTLRVSWSGFYDKESHIATFRVAVGRASFEYDIIPYQNFGIVTDAKFQLVGHYGISLGETIIVTVEAINGAGLSTKVASLPSRVISDTDGNLVGEEDFSCVNVIV